MWRFGQERVQDLQGSLGRRAGLEGEAGSHAAQRTDRPSPGMAARSSRSVRDNWSMPFALTDYDLACGQVISRVTKDLARASDPVLSQIKVVPMKGTVSSVPADARASEDDR
jgi:hypothetical protein